MKKYTKISVVVVLVIVTVFVYYNIFDFFKQMSEMEPPEKIVFPEDYKNLFNESTQTRIKHIYSDKFIGEKTYPVSFIKIDSLGVNIFKYRSSNSFQKILNIKDKQPSKGIVINIYYSFGSSDIDKFYRRNLATDIDTIFIRSTKPVDTLLFTQNMVILKGTMGNLEIKVDKSKQRADQFLNDETYFKNASKYYLVWIQNKSNIYELFIENEKFDDKKILSFFK